jgi:hypothetical protein
VTAKALQDVPLRPQEDQEALADYARKLEARRTGIYRLTCDERTAIQRARDGEYVPDEEMDWKRHNA